MLPPLLFPSLMAGLTLNPIFQLKIDDTPISHSLLPPYRSASLPLRAPPPLQMLEWMFPLRVRFMDSNVGLASAPI
jgi:hypothetical protein